MRQKRKQWKLLICMGMCLMLAGMAAACSLDRTNPPKSYVNREEGVCLPGSFTFDMIYPFRMGHRILQFYFYEIEIEKGAAHELPGAQLP